MSDFERTPADSFSQRLQRLRGCLDRLPQRLREVVDLGYGRDLVIRQIAGALSASEEAIKKRLQRARRLLLECLQARGESS